MGHHFFFGGCGGTGRRAKMQDLAPLAWGFDSLHPHHCGRSSVGRAQPCQGWGREFELVARSIYKKPYKAGVAELADAQDLKSCGR